MAISSFSNKVESISSQTQQFGRATTGFISELRNRHISVPNAESTHDKMLQTFQNTMHQISQIKNDIVKSTTYYNQEEMFLYTAQVTGYETALLEQLNTFNDAVLTYYPTAKIAYGEPCIGDKTAPKIETRNPKVLQMLENCSYIRKIRGDGNCFLSSFTTCLLENLVEKKQIETLLNLIIADEKIDFQLKEELVNILLYIPEHPSQLEVILKNNHKILPFINYFRQVAANEMKYNKIIRNDCEPTFSSEIEMVYHVNVANQSYESLVDKYVLSMGTDFCHHMIVALCRKLDFPVCIIDPKIGAENGVNVLDRPNAAATFCRQDNHYYVLYPRQAAPILPIQAPSITLPVQQIYPGTQTRPTEIIVNCKVPSGHHLYIRGSGNDLNWGKGIQLTKIDDETWAYLPSTGLQDMQYKFLIDDVVWQEGDDNKISQGKIEGTNRPRFAPTAQIFVKFNGNGTLFIHGTGPGMSWQQGVRLDKIDNNTWVFNTLTQFENFEYKLVLNDQTWENGPNHRINCGKKEEIIPQFN